MRGGPPARRLLILVVFLLLTESCGSYRLRSVWEVPNGYRGWVLIERANPRCKAAKLTFASVVFEIDSSGHGCTSTALPKASQFLIFWEGGTHGQGRELQSGYPGNGGQIWGFRDAEEGDEAGTFFTATEFFVGTEMEYRDAQKTRPKWWLRVKRMNNESR